MAQIGFVQTGFSFIISATLPLGCDATQWARRSQKGAALPRECGIAKRVQSSSEDSALIRGLPRTLAQRVCGVAKRAAA
jgi:hypothetical protein